MIIICTLFISPCKNDAIKQKVIKANFLTSHNIFACGSVDRQTTD